ncbi:MBL fold metallo-hydrolase [Coleofasciculus sp. F4-SAH-05]|uniref:MBL fold metallo-hydrolase n=1 Tax=Coleofasciculus sp. F4-SAH-05 TaxID=3069525 RepID=UPI0033004F6E
MQTQKNACQLTVLVENTAYGRGLLGEHGLSYLIETDSQRVLFDTGQGLTLRHNAQQLGISLQNLDAVALSHGHYDHTGGLITVLEDCKIAKLFLHPAALQPKFSPRGNIGSPIQDADRLKQAIDQLVWTDKPTEVIPGIQRFALYHSTIDEQRLRRWIANESIFSRFQRKNSQSSFSRKKLN